MRPVSNTRETLELMSGVPPGRIEVLGDGALAGELRRHLRPTSSRHGWWPLASRRSQRPPLAIVETTGSAEMLARALTRVASRGIVVLAADRTSKPLPVNLYPDVHVRGVRMIGVRGDLD